MKNPFRPLGRIENNDPAEPPARDVRPSGTRLARSAVPPELPPTATLEEVHAHYKDYVLDRLQRSVPRMHVEDVYQSVFLHMAELYGKEVRPESVFALLCRVIMIQVLDDARARRRFPFCDDGTLTGALAAGGRDPEQDAHVAEQKRIAREALTALPWTLGQIVFWLDLVGMPNDAVAEVLGCDLPTLYTLHHRARKAFYENVAALEGKDQEGAQ